MNDKSIYTISDLSRRFDLTSRTIRFYESEGLLTPERENNRRIYRERDMTRLKLILRGKRLGFSLAEIKKTMQLYDIQSDEIAQLHYVLQTIQTRREELKQKQIDIINTLDEMEEVSQRIRDTLKTLERRTNQQEP